MKRLIFIYDYICPYCYIMFSEIKRLQTEYAVKMEWVPIEIFSETPDQGIPMIGVVGRRKFKKTQALIESMAQEKTIPFYQPKTLYNTKLATLLTVYANGKVDTMEVVEALFNSVFIYNNNIADLDIIRKVCVTVGIDFEEFKNQMDEDDLEKVNKVWQDRFKKQDFQVVPTVITNKNTLIQGVCTFEELVKMME